MQRASECGPCVFVLWLLKRQPSTLKNGSTKRASGAFSARIPCVACVKSATVARRERWRNPRVRIAAPTRTTCQLQKSKCAWFQCATARRTTPRGHCVSFVGSKKTRSRAAARGASAGPSACRALTGCVRSARAVLIGEGPQLYGRRMVYPIFLCEKNYDLLPPPPPPPPSIRTTISRSSAACRAASISS